MNKIVDPIYFENNQSPPLSAATENKLFDYIDKIDDRVVQMGNDFAGMNQSVEIAEHSAEIARKYASDVYHYTPEGYPDLVATAERADSTATTANSTANLALDKTNAISQDYGAISDCNNFGLGYRVSGGIYNSQTLNAPSQVGYILQQRVNDGYDETFIIQLAMNFANNETYRRTKYASWGAWEKVTNALKSASSFLEARNNASSEIIVVGLHTLSTGGTVKIPVTIPKSMASEDGYWFGGADFGSAGSAYAFQVSVQASGNTICEMYKNGTSVPISVRIFYN